MSFHKRVAGFVCLRLVCFSVHIVEIYLEVEVVLWQRFVKCKVQRGFESAGFEIGSKLLLGSRSRDSSMQRWILDFYIRGIV